MTSMARLNPINNLPNLNSVDATISAKISKEFITINELLKLFILQYTNTVDSVYKARLDKEIKYNPRVQSYERGFDNLLYNMKEKLAEVMDDEIKNLKLFFGKFVKDLNDDHFSLQKIFENNSKGNFLDLEPGREDYHKLNSFLKSGNLYQEIRNIKKRTESRDSSPMRLSGAKSTKNSIGHSSDIVSKYTKSPNNLEQYPLKESSKSTTTLHSKPASIYGSKRSTFDGVNSHQHSIENNPHLMNMATQPESKYFLKDKPGQPPLPPTDNERGYGEIRKRISKNRKSPNSQISKERSPLSRYQARKSGSEARIPFKEREQVEMEYEKNRDESISHYKNIAKPKDNLGEKEMLKNREREKEKYSRRIPNHMNVGSERMSLTPRSENFEIEKRHLKANDGKTMSNNCRYSGNGVNR